MKNATKYADEMRSLLKKLLRDHKPEPRQPHDPLESLVRAAMAFDVSDSRASDAMKAINEEFVDLNELRVATDLEIQEMLGVKYPAIERRVAMITQSLNNIFEREHTLSLDRLKTVSKRDARQFLKELPDIHPFVEGYVMLFALEGNAVPLDDEMLTYLRHAGVVDESANLEEAQKFVEHHLKGDEFYEFYSALRRAVYEGDDGKSKKKKG